MINPLLNMCKIHTTYIANARLLGQRDVCVNGLSSVQVTHRAHIWYLTRSGVSAVGLAELSRAFTGGFDRTQTPFPPAPR